MPLRPSPRPQCDHCGWHTDHHDDDPPIGRAVTRIVNPTTTTKETTP